MTEKNSSAMFLCTRTFMFNWQPW